MLKTKKNFDFICSIKKNVVSLYCETKRYSIMLVQTSHSKNCCEGKDFTELRKKIDSNFAIRLVSNSENVLLSFTTFVDRFGILHASHVCEKALKSQKQNPQFRLKGRTITFVWR